MKCYYIRNIYQENESFFDYILNLDTAVACIVS